MINRGWHQLNTKYNVVFNGNESFTKSWTELQSGYYEDFWHILPIERLKVDQKYAFNIDADEDSPFSLAEEKAVKAIQKHSMLIENQERNTQMVEAYLLLGKARYYDQRFVPAYEAFNFIIQKYQASNLLNKVRIWKERTNIRLGNEAIAIENLKRLLKYRRLKPQEHADANATMAQAYMNTDSLALAMERLKIAKNSTRKNVEKARYGFILGQLFTANGQLDSAKTQFDEIVSLNRRVPRAFWVHSKLRSLRFENIDKSDQSEHLLALEELANSWSNQEFLDKIYYQEAVVHFETQRDSLGVDFANKSLYHNKEDRSLQGMTYELLADYYFNDHQYVSAKNYYDSLLPYIPNPSKRYRTLQKRILKITDVAYFEEKLTELDSVLALAKLPLEDQKTQIEKHIASLVARDSLKLLALKAEEAQKSKEEAQQRQQSKNQFYFYNPALIERGSKAFKMKWGERALVDNWRWENKTKQSLISGDELNIQKEISKASAQKKLYDPTYYLSKIPKEAHAIDSLQYELHYAHLRLGTLYKDNFGLLDLALNHLQIAVESPQEKIKLPALYEMYKTYDQQENSSEAISTKNKIISLYPESVYAKVLLHPDNKEQIAPDKKDEKYAEVYQWLQEQEYAKVIAEATLQLENTTETVDAGRWQTLKAQAIGKLYGYQAYKKELQLILSQFPGSEAAKQAETYLKNSESVIQQSDFGEASRRDHWKLAILVSQNKTVNDSILERNMRSLFKDDLSHLRFSKDVYSPEENFYVIHGFSSKSEAIQWSKNEIFNSEPFTNGEFFVILASHYRKIQLYKNLVAYKTDHKSLKR